MYCGSAAGSDLGWKHDICVLEECGCVGEKKGWGGGGRIPPARSFVHLHWKTCSAILIPDRRLGETCRFVIGQIGHVKERRALIG